MNSDEAFTSARGSFERLEELLPGRSRKLSEIEELSQQTSLFQGHFEDAESLCSQAIEAVEQAQADGDPSRVEEVISKVDALQERLTELKREAQLYAESVEAWANGLENWSSEFEDVMGYETVDEIRTAYKRTIDAADEISTHLREAHAKLDQPVEDLRRFAAK